MKAQKEGELLSERAGPHGPVLIACAICDSLVRGTRRFGRVSVEELGMGAQSAARGVRTAVAVKRNELGKLASGRGSCGKN